MPNDQTLPASAAPRSQPSTHSVHPAVEPAQHPATLDDFRRELTACLALCGAAGLDRDDRREWLIAARGTLDGIPADLLTWGCDAARRTADHPSKIIPAIMKAIGQAWQWRRDLQSSRSQAVVPVERRVEPPIEAIPAHEIRAMPANLRRMGLAKGWITQAQIDAAMPAQSEAA